MVLLLLYCICFIIIVTVIFYNRFALNNLKGGSGSTSKTPSPTPVSPSPTPKTPSPTPVSPTPKQNCFKKELKTLEQ